MQELFLGKDFLIHFRGVLRTPLIWTLVGQNEVSILVTRECSIHYSIRNSILTVLW